MGDKQVVKSVVAFGSLDSFVPGNASKHRALVGRGHGVGGL